MSDEEHRYYPPTGFLRHHLNIASDDADPISPIYLYAAEAWINRWLEKPLSEMAKEPPYVPDDLRQATFMLAAHWYRNREASVIGVSSDEIPFGVWDIVNQHRVWAF